MTRAENTASPLSVYTIPAGQNFARAMVRHFLETHDGHPEQLGHITLLLPTRRACRTFQDMFLQESNGKPLLLPKIQPLGDVDEQDLSLSLAGTQAMAEILALPPAISPLQRRVILARTIAPLQDFSTSFDQALALADALAAFMDQIIIEGLDFSNLAHIVPEEFANHWQITLDFLKILSENWPNILSDMGVIDAADRRNRLMRILAGHWQKARPQSPIYAAGSTGSIPATAQLMKIIAGLPDGHIVLPGLDQNMDQESWDTLQPAHPQYGLKHLLEHLDLPRGAVKVWPSANVDTGSASIPSNQQDTPRIRLAREMMRPAATTHHWTSLNSNTSLQKVLASGLEGISLIEADHQHEESLAIALEFRQTLNHAGQTAVLVTPDRKLARRVSNHCKRWGITVDDSAGQPLSQSNVGIYLRLLCEAAQNALSPLSFLELLKHNFCRAGLEEQIYQHHIHNLEILALRGLKPARGFAGLSRRLDNLDPSYKSRIDQAQSFLDHLEPIMTPFIEIMSAHKTAPFAEFLKLHITLAEALARTDSEYGANRLWAGEAGENAAGLLSELSLYTAHFSAMDGATYKRVMTHFLEGVAVRPRHGTHPRLTILGQLEARLIDADLVILGGLNEGTWPPDPGHDPWMSRPMRKNFGLPDPDRSIGLAAHDFMQGFCNARVIMTRAKTVDGTMSVPARWLQRLDTVVKAANLDPASYRTVKTKSWIEALDKAHSHITPAQRPSYAPPLEYRPKKLSVTKIETWLKDPYAIYAREILKLRKLDDLEKPIDAAEMGTLLHAVMEKFVKEHKTNLPADAHSILMAHAKEHIDQLNEDPAMWSFWWPRFDKICRWFTQHEYDWRHNRKARPLALEAAGEITLQTETAQMTLSGKLDRIDLMPDGSCAIIDYKSGGNYTSGKVEKGELSQLPLEAMMLDLDGFAAYGIRGKMTSSLHYWIMSGGNEAGQAIEISDNTIKSGMEDLIMRTRCGLENLITAFADDNTPYICLPKAHAQPRFNDYAHFERIQEWAALEDEDDSGNAEMGGVYG